MFVPDFMAALSDPRAFRKAAQERSDNMNSLGIEEAAAAGDLKKAKEVEKVEG